MLYDLLFPPRNKGFLTSRAKLAEDIVENPHAYAIYEGVSLLTNISRYDLPDPEIYRDFFRWVESR